MRSIKMGCTTLVGINNFVCLYRGIRGNESFLMSIYIRILVLAKV